MSIINRIIYIIYIILNFLFGYKKPGKVNQLKLEIVDMSNILVTWTLPEVTARQRPIQHTEISVRVDPSLPWTVQDVVVPGSVQELSFFDVAPGDHYYQAVIVDVDGLRGAPVETSVNVPFDPPGTVTTLTATLQP